MKVRVPRSPPQLQRHSYAMLIPGTIKRPRSSENLHVMYLVHMRLRARLIRDYNLMKLYVIVTNTSAASSIG